MVDRIFKLVVLVLLLLPGIAAPTMVLAGGCVENVDTTISFIETGKPHQVGRIVDYMALVSKRDLQNSNGLRLKNVAAVLQQDRANLHKSGMPDLAGDFRDTEEDYFSSYKRRKQLSAMRYYADCNLSISAAQTLQDDILNAGGVGTLWVVIFQHPDGQPAAYLSQVN